MAIRLKKFDAAKHFDTPEAQARLLNDAFESGHPGYIAKALGTIARARGMSKLADDTGLSRGSLYAALSDDGNPSLDTIMKVTRSLGIHLHASPEQEQHEQQECRVPA